MEIAALATPAGERRYLLARPPAAGRPLVLLLPGAGATAAWADAETGWSALAAREGFALAVPEGLPPDPARPPKFLTNPPRWDDGPADPGDWLHSDADDVGFLTAVIGDAVRRTAADPRRVCAAGFSNGAGMAFRLAAERAELLAAVAPVAGHCRVPDPRPSRPVPTLYLIGTADPLAPPGGGSVRLPWSGRTAQRPPVADTLRRWAAAIGCATAPEVLSDAGGVREERFPGPVEFRAVFVEGLGHHWPGGRGRLGTRIGGPWSDRVNATEAIWDFFRKHAS